MNVDLLAEEKEKLKLLVIEAGILKDVQNFKEGSTLIDVAKRDNHQ